MKNSNISVVFFGNERLATGVTTTTPTLKALLAQGFHVKAVVSHNEISISRKTRLLEVEEVAKAHSIPVLLPKRMIEIEQELKNLKADVGVLVAFGKIIPQAIIDIFPHGIINIHPSALPKHRGPTPLESVILSGEPTTAVSIMKLIRSMDAGPVYQQQSVSLSGDETKQELADTLSEIGSQMIVTLLPDIIAKRVNPTEQNSTSATYDTMIQKRDGLLDWTKPADRLEREVRAYAGWPHSFTTFGDIECIITKARVTKKQGPPGELFEDTNSFGVFCKTDALLIEQLKPSGKREMSSKDFLLGYKSRFLKK